MANVLKWADLKNGQNGVEKKILLLNLTGRNFSLPIIYCLQTSDVEKQRNEKNLLVVFSALEMYRGKEKQNSENLSTDRRKKRAISPEH